MEIKETLEPDPKQESTNTTDVEICKQIIH